MDKIQRKYFITYGDQNYKKSSQRIAAQAEATGLFDRVLVYDKSDLDAAFQTSPLFAYKKGGGYFIWKPYVVEKALDLMSDGDILVYADCGCSIFSSSEWMKYFGDLKKHSALLFMLPLICEAYTRKNILEHFKENGRYWRKRYQVSATFFLIKKNGQTASLIREWKHTMIENPDFVIDVPKDRMGEESPQFIENRYDQSVFSALVYKYEKQYNLKILFHNFEGKDRFSQQAVVATRISDDAVRGGNRRPFLKNILYHVLAKPCRHLYQRYWTLRN